VTQQQSLSQTASIRPTNHDGFFTVMLRYGASNLYDSHLMATVPQDGDSATITGSNPFGTAQITLDGTGSNTDPTITYLSPTGGGGTPTPFNTGVPVAVSHVELGYNAYTEWGYWTQPLAMSTTEAPSTLYYFVNKGYYVTGDLTTDAQIAALRTGGVVGNYTGKAYGTHFLYGGAATDMTGTFSTTVNFATSQVTNFNVNVSGGSASASITGAFGTLSGNTGTFQLTPDVSMVAISGSINPGGIANGAVYGSSGQAVGGVWGVKGNASSATGMFQGTR
jgi:hypothetical protein